MKPIFVAAVVLLVALSSLAAIAALGAGDQVSPTLGTLADSAGPEDDRARAEPEGLGARPSADKLVSPPTQGRSAPARLTVPSPSTEFTVVNPAGVPVPNVTAAWIPDSGPPRALKVGSDGMGLVRSRAAGTLSLAAKGYYVLESYLAADRPAGTITLTLNPSLPIEIRLTHVDPKGGPLPSDLRVAGHDLHPTLLHSDTTGWDWKPSGNLTEVALVDRSDAASGVYVVEPLVECGRIECRLPYGFHATAVGPPGKLPTGSTNREYDFAVPLTPEHRAAGLVVEVEIADTPTVHARVLYEDASPYRGSYFLYSHTSQRRVSELGPPEPVDSEGLMRLPASLFNEATNTWVPVHDHQVYLTGAGGTQGRRLVLRAADFADGAIPTLTVTRPRRYVLRLQGGEPQSPSPVAGAVHGLIGGLDGGWGRAFAETSNEGVCEFIGAPGDIVTIVAEGYASKDLTLPGLGATADAPLDVILSTHPTFEVHYSNAAAFGAWIEIATLDGSPPTHPVKHFPVGVRATWSGHRDAPSVWHIKAEIGGIATLPSVRPSARVRVRVLDALGNVVAARDCRLADSPIDLRAETGRLQTALLTVTEEPSGEGLTGFLRTGPDAEISVKWPALNGRAQVGPVLPGVHQLGFSSWGGPPIERTVEITVPGPSDGHQPGQSIVDLGAVVAR